MANAPIISVRINKDLLKKVEEAKKNGIEIDYRQILEEGFKEILILEETMVSNLKTKLGSVEKEKALLAKRLEELKSKVKVKEELKEVKDQQALDDQQLLAEYRNLKEVMPVEFKALYMEHKEKYRSTVTSVDELVKAKFFVPLLKERIKVEEL